MSAIVSTARRAWRNDLVRLLVLVLYYQAIIVGLIVIYGGSRYQPPGFIYQGF